MARPSQARAATQREAVKRQQFDSDVVRDVRNEDGTAVAGGVASGLAAHIADNANPHAVTAAQVGINDTDDVPEGGNLYFTDERAQDAAAALFSAGSHTGITVTYTDGSNKIDLAVTGGGAMTYIGSVAVAGSAATTLPTGSILDLDADTSYYFQIEGGNATASALVLSLFFNADTTATNYDIQAGIWTGSTQSAGRANSAAFMGCAANANFSIQGWITKAFDGSVTCTALARQDLTTAINMRMSVHKWRTTGTNLTAAILSSSVATSLAVGTIIRIWKIDT